MKKIYEKFRLVAFAISCILLITNTSCSKTTQEEDDTKAFKESFNAVAREAVVATDITQFNDTKNLLQYYLASYYEYPNVISGMDTDLRALLQDLMIKYKSDEDSISITDWLILLGLFSDYYSVYEEYVGIYEPNSTTKSWEKTADSDQIIKKFKNQNGEECTYCIILTGDFWDTFPSSTQILVTQNEKKMVNLIFTISSTLISPSELLSSKNIGATISLELTVEESMKISAKISGDNDNADVSINVEKNGTSIIEANGSLKGNNLTNISNYISRDEPIELGQGEYEILLGDGEIRADVKTENTLDLYKTFALFYEEGQGSKSEVEGWIAQTANSFDASIYFEDGKTKGCDATLGANLDPNTGKYYMAVQMDYVDGTSDFFVDGDCAPADEAIWEIVNNYVAAFSNYLGVQK